MASNKEEKPKAVLKKAMREGQLKKLTSPKAYKKPKVSPAKAQTQGRSKAKQAEKLAKKVMSGKAQDIRYLNTYKSLTNASYDPYEIGGYGQKAAQKGKQMRSQANAAKQLYTAKAKRVGYKKAESIISYAQASRRSSKRNRGE